jgi:L-lysine 6-monooxygenase/L-ornithine 5-monooxygenase
MRIGLFCPRTARFPHLLILIAEACVMEWLIIGGGIHGTYLTNLLMHQPDLTPEDIGLLDPHDTLLAAWNRMTTNCGMRFLRSPATHHIDLPILSIYRFAKTPEGQSLADFIPPYNRPSLPLFRAHSAEVITRNGIAERHIQGRALTMRRDGRRFIVETTCGPLRTRRVLLAIGMSEQPAWPSWAQRLRREGAPITHVFEPAFHPHDTVANGPTLVVGGGITAAQTALSLADDPRADVILIARRALQESQFDFNPCWIGPKCLRRFYQEDYDTRRTTIDKARLPGSLPGEVLKAFEQACKSTRLAFRQSAIREAVFTNGTIRFRMENGLIEAHRIVLATGFRQERPGGRFVDRLIEDFGLPCNPCGYPIVGENLQWGQHIYVSGPLAELQIGPCARNIVGARNAGRLLMASLADD